jgi:proline dehydrogenase
MSVFRGPVLAIAERPFVRNFVSTNRFLHGLVDRFVAGEDLETALDTVAPLAEHGITFTLDELGENVSTQAEAEAAVSSYIHILKRAHERGLEPNISIKLTMLGLDLGEDLTRANVEPILDAARKVGGFVRIDMEGSAYTEQTIRIFEEFHDRFPAEVGIVLQTCLRRCDDDVERMIERNARVRLVKGAYAEPPEVAYQEKASVDAQYLKLMKRLLKDGNYPAIATHDPELIAAAREFTSRHSILNESWEFQMLYGVRRDEQLALREAGYGMRVYVPYGPSWNPYFTRRIAERPANALFVLRQFVSR